MTAEIVIMNKEAIAMAADSAVTLSGETDQKIFTSANKIFALSKYHPVGIMIYGSALFMGVPWETLIKIYRSELGRKNFDTLKEYAEDFIDFLKQSNEFFPESEQDKYFKATVYGYFFHIKEDIKQETFSEKEEIPRDEVEEVVSNVIKKHYDIWTTAELPSSISENLAKNLIDKYRTAIDEAKTEVFENLPITKSASDQLTEIAGNLFVKFPENVSSSSLSGVVIAGFGAKDIFPSLHSFFIEGVINDVLKYKEDENNCIKITFENNATIVPFAQREMVDTFMEGVEPGYELEIESMLFRIFEEYPEVIVDNIEELDDDKKDEIKMRLKEKISSEMFVQYIKGLKIYQRENFVNPVVNVVAMLPKDELAAMAESLVNLTSFKRKVSMERETVGGPVDVALISKGDGFIWINRKHYFAPELNPQFFEKYYMEVDDGKK